MAVQSYNRILKSDGIKEESILMFGKERLLTK